MNVENSFGLLKNFNMDLKCKVLKLSNNEKNKI